MRLIKPNADQVNGKGIEYMKDFSYWLIKLLFEALNQLAPDQRKYKWGIMEIRATFMIGLSSQEWGSKSSHI